MVHNSRTGADAQFLGTRRRGWLEGCSLLYCLNFLTILVRTLCFELAKQNGCWPNSNVSCYFEGCFIDSGSTEPVGAWGFDGDRTIAHQVQCWFEMNCYEFRKMRWDKWVRLLNIRAMAKAVKNIKHKQHEHRNYVKLQIRISQSQAVPTSHILTGITGTPWVEHFSVNSASKRKNENNTQPCVELNLWVINLIQSAIRGQ